MYSFVYIFIMSRWNRNLRGVEPKEVCFCRLCGAEIVQLTFANGTPYWTNVIWENRQRCVVLGAGNHHNFKPEHDCLKEAENSLRNTEATYREFYEKHESSRKAIEQMDAADAELIIKKEAIGDHQIVEVLKRIRASAETQFKTLDAQKPGIDQLVQTVRDRLELIRQGKCAVPQDKPAVGRTAKVVKGRKIPVGTEGKIFWMGIDQFREDAIRVGIEVNGQKHYTSSENIQIITT